MENTKKRTSTRKISFATIIFASLLVIVIASFEYNETYATLSNIVLTLNDVKLLREDDVSTLSLNFTLTNPSSFLQLQVLSFSVTSFLNDNEFQYLRRNLYFEEEVSPRETFQIQVHFQKLEPVDLQIIDTSMAENTWKWYFKIEIYVKASFKEAYLDFSQSYSGINIL